MELSYTLPDYNEGFVEDLLQVEKNEYDKVILLARTSFIISELEITGDFVLFLEIGSMSILIDKIDQFQYQVN